MGTKKAKNDLTKKTNGGKSKNINLVIKKITKKVQKLDQNIFFDAMDSKDKKDPRITEFVHHAQYCFAAIEQGIGFQKDKPIEGVKALSLSVILGVLGIDLEEAVEESTNLMETKGSASFEWNKGEKVLKFTLYFIYETDQPVYDYIYYLLNQAPF